MPFPAIADEKVIFHADMTGGFRQAHQDFSRTSRQRLEERTLRFAAPVHVGTFVGNDQKRSTLDVDGKIFSQRVTPQRGATGLCAWRNCNGIDNRRCRDSGCKNKAPGKRPANSVAFNAILGGLASPLAVAAEKMPFLILKRVD